VKILIQFFCEPVIDRTTTRVSHKNCRNSSTEWHLGVGVAQEPPSKSTLRGYRRHHLVICAPVKSSGLQKRNYRGSSAAGTTGPEGFQYQLD
jgi:hypothetical protein